MKKIKKQEVTLQEIEELVKNCENKRTKITYDKHPIFLKSKTLLNNSLYFHFNNIK